MNIYDTNKEYTVYVGRNIDTSKVYVGVCDGDIGNSDYNTSTRNSHLIEAIRLGEIEFTTVAFGSKYEMLNLEHFILSRNNAKSNSSFYNNSNGGGVGVVQTYKPDSELVKKIESLITDGVWKKNITNFKKINIGEINNLVYRVQSSISAGGSVEFPIEEYCVHKISILEKKQVRAIQLISNKVQGLSSEFAEEASARTRITPIIIITKNGKPLMLIDGNHRAKAAEQAGWLTLPTIFIDISKFGEDEFNISHFGQRMNHNPVQRDGNSIDDLVRTIRILQELNLGAIIDSRVFIDYVIGIEGGRGTKLNGNYKNSDIVRKCKDLGKLDSEFLARNSAEKNFIEYVSSPLQKQVWKISDHHNNKETIFQSIDGVNNGGLGGVLTYIKNQYKKTGEKKANLVIHIGNITDYNNKKYIKVMEELLETLDITNTREYVNIFYMHPFELKIVTDLNEL